MHAITNSKSEPGTRLQRVHGVTAADGWKRRCILPRLLVAIAIARARRLSKRRMGTRGHQRAKKKQKKNDDDEIRTHAILLGFNP